MGLLAAAVAAPAPASAESFLDLYVGAAFPSDSDVTRANTTGKTSWKTSVAAGGRLGYYFEGIPWLGLALDTSWFRAEEDLDLPLKIDVVPISVLVMARLPLLTSARYPRGQVQPYVGIGPSFVYTNAEQPLNVLGQSGEVTEDSFDVGFDVRGGVTWMFTPTIGVFGEYGFLYVKPEYDASGVNLRTEIEMNVHRVVGGITFRF